MPISDNKYKLKRFKNGKHKVSVILSVFKSDEELKGKEICRRIHEKGYKITEIHLRMFIYHRLVHKYLKKERVKGVNRYSLLNNCK